MSIPPPLETLFERTSGPALPLSPALASFYGPLRLSGQVEAPFIYGNFVTSLDGVVSLNEPGHNTGADISGSNPSDRLVMSLLRAAADAVVVGSGTLEAEPDHLWTAEYLHPALAPLFAELRRALGKTGPPLNVIVTASGKLDPAAHVFQGEVPALVVTTREGKRELQRRKLPAAVEISVPAQRATKGKKGRGAAEAKKHIRAHQVIEAVRRLRPVERILVEGGPRLMADFFVGRLLRDLFLTLAPQVVGRDDVQKRPGLAEGRTFAPEQPLWCELASVRRAAAHLFLRYSFGS